MVECAVALRAILDQTQAIGASKVTKGGEFGRLAIQVHGQNRRRPTRVRYLQSSRKLVWRHRISFRLDIYQYGHRTDPFDRRDGRDCSMRYCKHDITSTDVASAQGKLDRIRPACTADGVSNTNEIGKGGLEGLDLFTENIAAALQNASYGAVNRGLMR